MDILLEDDDYREEFGDIVDSDFYDEEIDREIEREMYDDDFQEERGHGRGVLGEVMFVLATFALRALNSCFSMLSFFGTHWVKFCLCAILCALKSTTYFWSERVCMK